MTKPAPVTAKRRGVTETRKRGLKRQKKKIISAANLQKRGVLGKVNGFTVTRLEPEKLKLTRIFPEGSRSPSIEGKRVTFGGEEVAEQSDDSRTQRANSRRTHSARDSSVDSLNDFDASREPKRRRTIDSDIVEDAEVRKATSSMRLSKVGLHHSTPAETGENLRSTSKRIFPRTPKPADESAASANDTSENSTSREDGEVGAQEPKVSLASLFDEDTHAEDNDGQGSVPNVSSTVPGTGPAMTCEGEMSPLNSDDTTLGLEAIPPNSIERSELDESKSLGPSCDVTPVRAHSRNTRENSTLASHERSMEKTGRASDQAAEEKTTSDHHQESKAKTGRVSDRTAEESELVLSLGDEADAGGELKVDSTSNASPRKSLSSTEDGSTTSSTSLDEKSVSRLSRRDSPAKPDPSEAEDVFKQRRSQLSLDEEEPMEVSMIQAASRRSKIPTPGPDTGAEKMSESGDVSLPPESADPSHAQNAEDESTESAAVVLELVRKVSEQSSPVTLSTALTTETTAQVRSVDISSVEPDSGSSGAHPTLAEESGNAAVDVNDESEALSYCIQERDRAPECPVPNLPSENTVTRDDVVPTADNLTTAIDPATSEGEPSSIVGTVSSGALSSVLKTSSTPEAPSGETQATHGSVPSNETPQNADAAARDEAPSDPNAAESIRNPDMTDHSAPVETAAVIAEEGESGEVEGASEDPRKSSASDQRENDPSKIEEVAEKSRESGGAELEVIEEPLDSAGAAERRVSTKRQDAGTVQLADEIPGSLQVGRDQSGAEETREQKSDGTPHDKFDKHEVQTEEAGEAGEREPTADGDLGEGSPPISESGEEQETADREKTSGTSVDPGDATELDQGSATETETETATAAPEEVVDPQSSSTRQKRVRRLPKLFSPPPDNLRATAAASASKKRTARAKAIAETSVLTEGTPKNSRRAGAKGAGSQPAADAGVEATPKANASATATTKAEETPVSKSGKTPAARTKAARTPAARTKAPKAETDQPVTPSGSPEAPPAPKTPSRAAGSKKAASRTPKTPAASSKSSKATPSSKVEKSKDSPGEAPTAGEPSPPKGSKSAVKSSRASAAASARRKTLK